MQHLTKVNKKIVLAGLDKLIPDKVGLKARNVVRD